MFKKTSVVVVTYNRLALLKENIYYLRKQSTSLNHIIIVNGDSIDGTREWLSNQKDLIVINLHKNIGGAGGFNIGVRTFMEKTQDDFVWLMDDDCFPQANALEKLLLAFDEVDNIQMAASKVLWKDGSISKMNVVQAKKPSTQRDLFKQEKKFVFIKKSTFVSTIISRKAVEKVGLPQKEYFIWGDDIEYTQRISNTFLAVYVKDSIVVHYSAKNSKPGDISSETNHDFLKRYNYEFRNRLLTSRRRHSIFQLLRTIIHSMIDLLKTLFKPFVKYRWEKLTIILSGTCKGLTWNPKIEYVRSNKNKQ
ncbi:glycosyltransferase family 2 protein [Oenococcus oeni]|uniref:Predicted glycosyltransferase n=14 Tax=Oenococcus oeni TaxID=1247 RepID=Q04D86_OENOB|nr:glycosyltransferase family 2 protein [Oenococcus oeni]EAV38953.1 glycosyltransferase [Oenococcus oeni ATCC BAA-1163]ABJ57586.1 Predicted glycosyltransferase [Oenococcus oeni PSU-1]EJO02819.1 glycosyltransferase [Oenococcus oeni AWRIB418]KDP20010.1 glycosyl transferase [Oenococcus oeni]KGH59870.1 glycosyl transferase [Oenococcus oeni IOEB_9805]